MQIIMKMSALCYQQNLKIKTESKQESYGQNRKDIIERVISKFNEDLKNQVLKVSQGIVQFRSFISSSLMGPLFIYYYVQMKDAFLKFEATIKSEHLLANILQLGTSRLLSEINNWNVKETTEIKMVWLQNIRAIAARSSIYSLNFNSLALQDIIKKIEAIEQFILAFLSDVVNKNSSALQLSQEKTQKLQNSQLIKIKNTIKYCKNLFNSQLQQFPIKPTLGEQDVKFKLKEGNQLNLIEKWLKQSLIRIAKCEEKNKCILGLIKIVSKLEGQEEEINCGNNSIVTRAKFVYYQLDNRSLNKCSNFEIEAAEKELIMGLETTDEVFARFHQGYLVKKEPVFFFEQDFNNEKSILCSLRSSKCSRIASYYLTETEEDLNSKCLYIENYPYQLHQIEGNSNRKLDILIELAEGLMFLHRNSVLHRDLKFQNVLLSKDLKPKIIDFGSGVVLRNAELESESVPLRTTRYYNYFYEDLPTCLGRTMSRQFFERHPKFDIYSFGKIMENFCLKFEGKKQMGEFVWENLLYLAKSCSNLNPDLRFSARNIYIFLKHLRGYTRLLHYKKGIIL